jgi:hypothetical protein
MANQLNRIVAAVLLIALVGCATPTATSRTVSGSAGLTESPRMTVRLRGSGATLDAL